MSQLITFGTSPENAAVREIAKILTANEGNLAPQQNEEIFQILFNIKSVRDGMNNFFKKETTPVGLVFKHVLNTESITDVIDLLRDKIDWVVSIQCARIPTHLYEMQTPEHNCTGAGEALGLVLAKQLKKPLLFVYGDSRIYSGNSIGSENCTNVAFIFVYKEEVSQYQ